MTALPLVPTAFQPDISPVADSLAISALVALLPLITVFLTLGALRWKAHWAGLTSVAVAILVASLFFGMPLNLAVLAATQGAAFGLFPIMWIVFTAILLYQVTVRSGRAWCRGRCASCTRRRTATASSRARSWWRP